MKKSCKCGKLQTEPFGPQRRSRWCSGFDAKRHGWCANRNADETHCQCPCHRLSPREHASIAVWVERERAQTEGQNKMNEQLAYPCGITATGTAPLPTACPEHGAVCGDPLLDPDDPETQRRIAAGTISAIGASSALLELRLSELETATQNLSRFLRDRAQTAHTGACKGDELFGTSASCPVCWRAQTATPPRAEGQERKVTESETFEFKDTAVLAAQRRAFDQPTIANLDALIEAVRSELRLMPRLAPWHDPYAEGAKASPLAAGEHAEHAERRTQSNGEPSFASVEPEQKDACVVCGEPLSEHPPGPPCPPNSRWKQQQTCRHQYWDLGYCIDCGIHANRLEGK